MAGHQGTEVFTEGHLYALQNAMDSFLVEHTRPAQQRSRSECYDPRLGLVPAGMSEAWAVIQDSIDMGYRMIWVDQRTYQQLDTIKNNRNCAFMKDVIQLLLERYVVVG